MHDQVSPHPPAQALVRRLPVTAMANQFQTVATLLLVVAMLCGVGLLLQSALQAKQTTDLAKSADTQKGAVDEKTIRDLIKQLEDDSFEVREEATKRLTAIGDPARALVSKAAMDSPDAEVRQRAEQILRGMGVPALVVADALDLAKKPSFADAFKRSNIRAEVLAKMGSGRDDAPKELVAVLGKPEGKHLVISLSLSKDGRYLATGGQDESKAQIFDLKTGKLIKIFPGFAKTLRAVAISPDGKLLATAIMDKSQQLSLWDTETSTLRKALVGHTGQVWGLDFSPDGKLLASASFDRTARFWDVASGAQVMAPILHSTNVNRVAFSPDGKLLASASGTLNIKGEVIISETATGRVMDKLTGQASEIRGLAWHPDGKTLASASLDGTIFLWDLQTMKSTRVLRSAAKKVQAVAWHPSGQFLASNDHTVSTLFLWDMRAPKAEPRTIRLFPASTKDDEWTHDVIFTPEGRHLIAANPDGTVSVLRLAEIGQVLKAEGK